MLSCSKFTESCGRRQWLVFDSRGCCVRALRLCALDVRDNSLCSLYFLCSASALSFLDGCGMGTSELGASGLVGVNGRVVLAGVSFDGIPCCVIVRESSTELHLWLKCRSGA
jgi:hypothetical protein